MFAELSPVRRPRRLRAASKNILPRGSPQPEITRLTEAGSPEIINGTFDWVYEEEFGLRDGFRWSPDGRSIAYWQLDTRGVPEFPLVNSADCLYPQAAAVQVPQDRRAKLGLPGGRGGRRHQADPLDGRLPAIPATIISPGWTGPPDSSEVFLQQLNRLQNTAHVLLANAADRPGADRLHRPRRGLGRSVHDEHAVAARRRAVYLDQRARRLAARLPRLPLR